jgi:VWFA-related protein
VFRRRVIAVVVAVTALAVVRSPAQEPARTDQTFRTGVDVIRLDVTVLDKDRRPVRGLTANDFVIKENGRAQRLVAVTEVDAAAADPAPSAWMRYAPPDVTSNDLADRLGEGQAIGIVLDDLTIPEDSVEMIVSAREIARFIVNSMGPSDVAAVVYPFKPGRTQDFTQDRGKLLAAIDKFDPEQPEWRTLQPRYSGPIEGDIQRYNTALGRDPCLQLQPVIPTLRTVTSRLATVPNRRKALFYVSQGLPFVFRPGSTRCQTLLYDELRKAFETAQRYNVNMHGIDPAGAAGYQRYLQEPHIRNARLVPQRDLVGARQAASVRHDFLELLGEQTGGRPVTDNDDLEAAVAGIFEEYGSYYLLGYETTNGEPDGKFRRIEVDVPGRDLDVQAKSGRWAPDRTSAVANDGPRSVPCLFDCWHQPPPASDFQLVGLMPVQPLRMRGALYPVGRAAVPAGARANAVEIAAVLTVRMPAVVRAVDDVLTVVRTVYDANGKASAPEQFQLTQRLEPTAGDETRYEVFSRFALSPGRHQVRFNATSRAADDSGSVIIEIDVPDLSRPTPTASPIVLGIPPGATRTDPLAPLLPIVPTTVRDFTAADRITALVELFAGESGLSEPVQVEARVVGADDRIETEAPTSIIAVEAFAESRSARYSMDLPLPSLKPGLHVLSITATFDRSRIVRRDVVFRVR